MLSALCISLLATVRVQEHIDMLVLHYAKLLCTHHYRLLAIETISHAVPDCIRTAASVDAQCLTPHSMCALPLLLLL
jgi:hypothetical protein